MNVTTTLTPARKPEIDLLEYWQIVWKRKWVILSAVAILIALAALFSFSTTPAYRATATLLIEEPSSNRLAIQDFLAGQGVGLAQGGAYFNTQLRILQSRTIGERVAKKMNLSKRPELSPAQGRKQSLVQMLKGFVRMGWLFPGKGTAGSPSVAEADAAAADAAARDTNFILAGLSVRQIPDTRLVEVSFVSPHPRLAADIVNTLSREYVAFSVETRYEATQQTSEFLSGQIDRLRDDLATKERELQKYSEEKKILQLNEKDSNIVSKYSDLQKAAMTAQVDRINAEAQYRELSKLKADALPQVINNPTIQTLNSNFLAAKADYEEKIRTTYTPSHPDMIQLKARVDGLKGQLGEEIKKSVDAAYSSFRTSSDKEQRLLRELESQRVDVSRMNNDAILSRSLQVDINAIQEMLDKLVGQQNETLVSARLSGQMTSTIKIVDPALTPKIPFAPNTKRNLIVGFLLGGFLGIGLAFVINILDNTVKSPEDLEKLTGLPSLGLIPHFSTNGTKGKGRGQAASPYRHRSAYGKGDPAASELAKITEVELINHLFPKISIAEDYRTVRTAIQFSRAENRSRAIAFTSTSPQEGKSATVANMAISFAQLGERILVVDGDLRKPRLHKIFKVRNRSGLSDVLTGRSSPEETIQKTAVDNLSILPSGPHPPNPAELLNSRRMREFLEEMRSQYPTVLVDLPPVLAVIDPVIVSAMTDMTIVVVRMGVTTRKPLLRTIEELGRAKADIIGIILNDARIRRSSYGSYAPYFQYEYYEDKGEAEPAALGPKAIRA
jgi:polysaccharide biosynthesis transport protein